METEWVIARMELYHLLRQHPDWSTSQLAAEVGYSRSWVKKWRKRIRAAAQVTLDTFRSQSRAPKTRPNTIHQVVRNAILALRDSLQQLYHQRPGSKRILYHLQRDPYLPIQYNLPKSPRTITRILHEGERIPQKIQIEHCPLERNPPMAEWELDFGLVTLGPEQWLEFCPIIDSGTSIWIDTQVASGFDAEQALQALAQVLVMHGCPERLRFDRDTRLVGSWTTDGYPSAWVRFLQCVGIEPVICPPHRPDKKPFVERLIRTIKYEKLYIERPDNVDHGRQLLQEFRGFYNEERPHQGLSCANQPPLQAFPTLPRLPKLPDRIDPDAWLQAYHGRIYQRRVSASGAVMVDKYTYPIGRSYASQTVALHLNAQQQQFHVVWGGQPIKTLALKGLHHYPMPFQQYLATMLSEARSIEQHLRRRARRA